MLDPTLLSSPPTAPAARELHETDPELDEIVALAERSQFIPAAERAAHLWQQHVYDVRTLGFYLFGVFQEQGPPGLPVVLQCIEDVLSTSWPQLGPQNSKARHADVALRWLFINLIGHFRFHQRSQSADWKALLQKWEQLPQEQVFSCISRIDQLIERVLQEKEPLCRGHLHTLRTFLVNLPTTTGRSRDASRPAPPPELAVTSTQPAVAQAALKAPPDPAAAETAPPSTRPTLTIPLSPALNSLVRKLSAFSLLVKLGKLRQAAIVYKDLKQSIDKFDPRVYLPSLFAEYFSSLVLCAGKLPPILEATEDLTAQALLELYHVDLDLFTATQD